MRLLFVVNDPVFFISHRPPIALAARDAGYDVHVACTPGSAVADIERQGLQYHIHPVRAGCASPGRGTRSG
ncbi:MAG: glycosyltransferase [Gammaproteobacteria bacterium]|nr:glycosyltransferase [Gammaproteobacteria bacterium]